MATALVLKAKTNPVPPSYPANSRQRFSRLSCFGVEREIFKKPTMLLQEKTGWRATVSIAVTDLCLTYNRRKHQQDGHSAGPLTQKEIPSPRVTPQIVERERCSKLSCFRVEREKLQQTNNATTGEKRLASDSLHQGNTPLPNVQSLTTQTGWPQRWSFKAKTNPVPPSNPLVGESVFPSYLASEPSEIKFKNPTMLPQEKTGWRATVSITAMDLCLTYIGVPSHGSRERWIYNRAIGARQAYTNGGSIGV